MSAQIADFNIRFNTETAKFQKDVDYAKKMLRGYTKEAKAANDSNVSLGRSLEQTADRAKSAGRGVLDAAGYVSAGIGAVTGATAYLITQQAQQAREVEKMATVAQVSVQQIQALAYASEQYNISGESMADILKDVNDKLGDFTENEGGEFADFMTNIAPTVGLTIDQLQKLSGPEALVAVKAAMDEANVPMKSQIFYLESIANDASALMPLLDNQGKKLYELTKKYDDLNVSMSEYDIEKFKEMDQKLTDVGLKIQRSFANGVLGASEQIDWVTKKLTIAIDFWSTKLDSMSDNPKTASGILKKKHDAQDDARTVRIELERAQKALESLQATEKSAEDNIEVKAHLANSRFSEKVEKAETKVKRLKQEYAALLETVDKYHRQYEDDVLGFNRDGKSDKPKYPEQPPIRKLKPDSDTDTDKGVKNRVAAFRDATNQMQVEWQRRLALSAAGDQQEATQEVFAYQDKIARLKASFQEAHDAASADKVLQQELENEHFASRELLWQEHQENLTRIESDQQVLRDQAAKQRADTEERIEKSVLSMKFGVATQGLALIEQSAKKGSALQKAAFIAQKGMAAAQVWMQGEVAAAAALAPPPIGLGPIAGAGQATVIRALSAVSAGMIMGQAIAGMAHSGISEIPEEGTWLLNRGERVYTNQSANQVDQMYSAIMAMQNQRFAMNDPSLTSAKAAMVGGGRNIVNIYGVPEGARVEEREGENGENFTDVFLNDLDSDGPMSQGITTYFDAKRVGMN